MRTLITIALLVATAAALAREPSTSAYAGQEARTIKALSAEDIELIDAEARLDGLFASKQIDAQALSASLERIAELQAELRHTHLQAHLEQTRLLSAAQTARYIELRGYGRPQNQTMHEHH
jgi:hypothetical protein